MDSSYTRRKFLQTNSVALLAAQLPALAGAADGAASDAGKLAKSGGPKAVTAKPGRRVRWDEREKQQLSSAIDQPSLFYWAGGKPNQQTALFIERFKQYCPREHVVTCSSGTAALHVAVAAAGIGPGDEVITTPISDIGTIAGILFQQGVPVFADLGAATYNLDPKSAERLITPRTKAIIAVHLTGNPCDMTALKALADRHGLVLIEDCAQAWGAMHRGQPVGSLGHIGC
jgi:dTDP-4-amino-4,6-dideoxygalactose transaminase